MFTEREKYKKYIDEIVRGLLKANKKKAKFLGLNYKKLFAIVSKEVTFTEYLMGARIKKIKVNGMEYVRPVKRSTTNPANYIPVRTINTGGTSGKKV